MAIQLILSTFLYFLFFPAFISGILFSLNKRTNFQNPKYEKYFILLIHSTTLFLTISQIFLAIILVNVDTDFQIVMNSAASWMSTGELIAASWTDRWGSYHLWTWFTWVSTSLIFIRYYPKKSNDKDEFKDNSLFFEILLWGSIIILFLLMGQRPYRTAELGASPIGLNPSLLSIWNFIHPPLAFASYTGFFISWAISSYFWIKSPDMKNTFSLEIIKLDRLITRITWVLTSLVLTLGIIWSHEANWGGYWSWDGVIIVSIILWLVSGYRLHLHEIGSNQALYLLLGIIGFPLVFFAAWLITSNILEGLHNYAGSPVAPLFLGLVVITMVPLPIGWIRHKWQPLSPVRVSNDIAKPNGFNLGVLSFNFLIVGNLSILLLQIANNWFEFNREFEKTYPILNGIGFLGIALGLLIDNIQHKYNSNNIIIGIIVSTVIVGYIFWVRPINKNMSEIISSSEEIIKLVFILVVIFTIFILMLSEVNKKRSNTKISPRRFISHIAMLLVLLTIVANGSGPAIDTRQSSDPYNIDIRNSITIPDGLEILFESVEGPINNSRGQIVNIHLLMNKDGYSYERSISVINQTGYGRYIQATWITYLNGKEIFFNLQQREPYKIENKEITRIHLIVEEYFMTSPIWIATILFVLIPIIPIKGRNS